MNFREIFWETFKNTGEINAYLLYRRIDEIEAEDKNHEQHHSEGTYNQANQLW